MIPANKVSVRFVDGLNNKEYHYLTDLELKDGDLVVVDTINGFKTANVTNSVGCAYKATRWVVCQVDTEAFENKLSELKRRQFIYDQMEQLYDETNKLTRFAEVAKHDPRMAKLLAAYEDPALPALEKKDESTTG